VNEEVGVAFPEDVLTKDEHVVLHMHPHWKEAIRPVLVLVLALVGLVAAWIFLLQHGVFSRDRRDIPLGRVNDHSMSQTFIERLLGCGTLTIESAGERGQSLLRDMPAVEKVQTTLYELIEANHDKHSLGDEEMRDIMRESNRETRETQQQP
jgi:membrane protein YdbS with pleckstrin-like domain